MTETDWEEIAAKKREAILNAIPEPWRLETSMLHADQMRDVTGAYIQQFLTSREIIITETDAVGILQHTTTGKWSAREVTKAFCHRAVIAHQLVNCLHDIFIDLALEQADMLDTYYQTNKRPMGPLHGLPISLKDQFHVRGSETTMGYVGWINTFEGLKGSGKEKVFESQIVTDLRTLGAVFFCKTAVPPSLMSPETNNNFLGYLWNPKNRNLSAGGSSGGEGALLALRGSPLGFGSDIGGSVRVPAALNGVFGLRPSTGRVAYEGTPISMDGQETIPCVIGPLATSVRSLQFVMKALMSSKPWLHDPCVIELPWRDEHVQRLYDIVGKLGNSKRLSFGLLRKDDLVTPNPPVRRATDMVAEALERAGHEIIEWNPPSHSRGWEIAFQTWMFDGGVDIHAAFALSGEPIIPQISKVYGMVSADQKRASEIAATNIAKRQYQKEYLEYWNSTADLTSTGLPVEAFIAPLVPYGGVRRDAYHYYTYSAIVNCLDYSAVAIPVTQVDKSIDVVDQDHVPANAQDQQLYETYDPELCDGAFVGLQVVGRRLQEEKTLALADLISSLL